ncbi:splicing endonuclease positive effector [Stylonychia lemnae]|uniref:Splicing endonuclease positive effector n=1 Tax=Stylonychia lemnae TaxID=5949 RepID=A0A078B2X5_STYLE|nr:splicing endonuclease positive effector [Stylonychia lemnae]|eukprot:CDW88819.1 splicing endonuclease positive effector [Stylonychia lemnae]
MQQEEQSDKVSNLNSDVYIPSATLIFTQQDSSTASKLKPYFMTNYPPTDSQYNKIANDLEGYQGQFHKACEDSLKISESRSTDDESKININPELQEQFEELRQSISSDYKVTPSLDLGTYTSVLPSNIPSLLSESYGQDFKDEDTFQLVTDSERVQVFIERLLSLELLKNLQNPLQVRMLKPVTSSIDGDIEAYRRTWSALIEYEAFSKISSPHVKIARESMIEFQSGKKLSFMLNSDEKILIPVIPTNECVSQVEPDISQVCLYDKFISQIQLCDVFILSSQPIEINPKVETLLQLIEFVQTQLYNQGKFILSIVHQVTNIQKYHDQANSNFVLKISRSNIQFVKTLAARSQINGEVSFYTYFINGLLKDCQQLQMLDLIDDKNKIFKFILAPRRARQRAQLNPFDKVQGQMEIAIQNATIDRKLTPYQNELLLKYINQQKESMILINGAPGSGKTFCGLNIACLKLFASSKSKILFLVPNNEAMLNIVKLIYSDSIQKGQLVETSTEPHKIDPLYIMKKIFEDSSFIIATFDFLNQSNLNFLLPNLSTLIVDDAQSLIEPQLLLSQKMNLGQMILLGCEEYPRGHCFSTNLMQSQFNKSTMERLIEQDYPYLKVRGQLRFNHLMCQILNKLFYKQNPMNASRRDIVESQFVLKNFMRRVIMFDLQYLKELKQESFRSDFDEINFTTHLIGDLTKVVSEVEGVDASSYEVRNQHAFSKIKRSIGVIVPFERLIPTFKILFEPVKQRLGLDKEDDIFIGTTEMFRGVEKEIIIVTSLRNSVVDGLGSLEEPNMIKLAMTRAKSFFWVIGSSPCFISNQQWREFLMATKLVSIGQYNNYIPFEHHRDWAHPRMLQMLRSFIRKERSPRGSPRNKNDRSPRRDRGNNNESIRLTKHRDRTDIDGQDRSFSKNRNEGRNSRNMRQNRDNNNRSRTRDYSRGGNQNRNPSQQMRGLSFQDRLQIIVNEKRGGGAQRQAVREQERMQREREERRNKYKPTERDWEEVEGGNTQVRNYNNEEQKNDFW